MTKRVGDPEKAARELGFRTAIDLHDGLKRLIAWRREHKDQLAAPQALS